MERLTHVPSRNRMEEDKEEGLCTKKCGPSDQLFWVFIALNSIRALWSCVVQHMPPLCFVPTHVSLSFSLLVPSPEKRKLSTKLTCFPNKAEAGIERR